MKKIIAILFLVMCSLVLVMAQAYHPGRRVSMFTLGAFGGLNIPKLTGGGGNPLSEGWSSSKGGAFGLSFTWNTTQQLALSADVYYSGEGGQRNGMQALDGSSLDPQVPAGTYFYADYNNESRLNYINVPVMARYYFPLSKFFRVYLNLGPYVGFLLNAKQITSGSSVVYADASGIQPISYDQQTGQIVPVPFDANTDITNKINRVNFGLIGGAGITQKVGFGEIILNLRGDYGLSNIQRYLQDGKNHIGNLLISFGYSVPL
jgi:hypothetical protein